MRKLDGKHKKPMPCKIFLVLLRIDFESIHFMGALGLESCSVFTFIAVYSCSYRIYDSFDTPLNLYWGALARKRRKFVFTSDENIISLCLIIAHLSFTLHHLCCESWCQNFSPIFTLSVVCCPSVVTSVTPKLISAIWTFKPHKPFFLKAYDIHYSLTHQSLTYHPSWPPRPTQHPPPIFSQTFPSNMPAKQSQKDILKVFPCVYMHSIQ